MNSSQVVSISPDAPSYASSRDRPERDVRNARVAAGAMFFDDEGRVMLVHPTYKDTWDLPGGYVERGESPAAACRRELIEELQVDRKPIRLLSVDWAPSEKEGDKFLFLFDCGTLGVDAEKVHLDGAELDRWEWVHMDSLEKYVIPRLARRIRSTTGGGPGYLEHRETVTTF